MERHTTNRPAEQTTHKATKSKINTGTIAPERSVEETTGGGVGGGAPPQPAIPTLGPDAILNTKTHKNPARTKAQTQPTHQSVNKNQTNHNNKQRRALMANSTACQSK